MKLSGYILLNEFKIIFAPDRWQAWQKAKDLKVKDPIFVRL